MLANNFKAPAELQISDCEFEALVRVLGMLERGEIKPEQFDMDIIGKPDCGTAGCIVGWARAVGAGAFGKHALPLAAMPLFCPIALDAWDATPAQAAIALRSYLSTGEPNWAEAMAD